jgi:sigma-B regulation protein RsbU (phosphoserine phosphatase)
MMYQESMIEQREYQAVVEPNAVLSDKIVTRSGDLLVVDDNEMNRDMLSRRLQRQGHTVSVAANGREGLAMLATCQFDLILLDIMMPEMNGYEMLAHLKADPVLRHIPVIMITAVDEIESIAKCIELGAEDYLPKPFNPVLLKARIGASLEKKWLRDQQEAYTQRLDRENRRKSNELDQARQIQLAMLPTTPPTLPHLEIAALQKTASEVGGDYYDFFPQADGRLFTAIGDATGHGVGSGLMVAMTKAALLATDEAPVAVVMAKINTILTKIDFGKQLNMALLLLEISNHQPEGVTLRTSGGGIPPLYILRAGGAVEEILVSGLPLGITTEAVYTITEFSLNSGDTVLLMSDGLPEIFNPAREYLGLPRLKNAIEELHLNGLPAHEILERLVNFGETWAAGHPLHDDATLVAIKVK